MVKKKSLVIDTNILIAALGWNGNSRKLINLIIDGEFTLFITKNQINELVEVMGYPKFKFSNKQKEKFLDVILEISEVINPKIKLYIIKEDFSDNMFLECAYESDANFIITGDKHLLDFEEFKNTTIIKVKDFLDLIK